MLPIIALIVIIGIILFVVFAAKKNKEGEGLGDPAAGSTNQNYNQNTVS